MNKCPHCGAEHIHKSGKLPSGKQRWICNVCKKGFSTGTNIVKVVKNVVEDKCPYCVGELRTRGWNTSGTRRYKCKDCGKSCSGEIGKLTVKITNNPPCVYCGSTHTRKGGTLKDGTKRYTCSECGKGFSAKTIVKEPVKLRCPKCNGESRRSGKQENGKQRYICKSCGHKFVENPTQNYNKFTRHEKECPNCSHKWAKKAGKSSGKQYYICLGCGHKYLEGGTYRHITKREIKQLIDLLKQNKSVKDIAEHFNKSEKTIRNVINNNKTIKELVQQRDESNRLKLKKLVVQKVLSGSSIYATRKLFNIGEDTVKEWVTPYLEREQLTQEQKQLIYKFGVQLAVPVEYLAPYVPCSKYICERFLKQYKIAKPKKIKLTDQEKAQDKMCLDKFIG